MYLRQEIGDVFIGNLLYLLAISNAVRAECG